MVLVDGTACPCWMCPAEAIVKGDARVPAISLSRRHRDPLADRCIERFPQYGAVTARALPAIWLCWRPRQHRRSFGPWRTARPWRLLPQGTGAFSRPSHRLAQHTIHHEPLSVHSATTVSSRICVARRRTARPTASRAVNLVWRATTCAGPCWREASARDGQFFRVFLPSSPIAVRASSHENSSGRSPMRSLLKSAGWSHRRRARVWLISPQRRSVAVLAWPTWC